MPNTIRPHRVIAAKPEKLYALSSNQMRLRAGFRLRVYLHRP